MARDQDLRVFLKNNSNLVDESIRSCEQPVIKIAREQRHTIPVIILLGTIGTEQRHDPLYLWKILSYPSEVYIQTMKMLSNDAKTRRECVETFCREMSTLYIDIVFLPASPYYHSV